MDKKNNLTTNINVLSTILTDEEKEDVAKNSFKRLKNHIGEKVIYKGWWYGKEQIIEDVLLEVENYSYVRIGCHGLPFVGHGTATVSIVTCDGLPLYSNPFIEIGYNRRSDEEVLDAERAIFGNKYVDAEIKKAAKERQKRDNNLKTKPKSPSLVDEGLKLVKPGTEDEWINFVEKNDDGGYASRIIGAVVSMMKKLDEKVPYEDAEKQAYCDEYGLSRYQAMVATRVLIKFAKQGEEYSTHHK